MAAPIPSMSADRMDTTTHCDPDQRPLATGLLPDMAARSGKGLDRRAHTNGALPRGGSGCVTCNAWFTGVAAGLLKCP
jgi:hypothetical protein